MKLNDGFSLKYIAGVPYILPFGQNIADYKRGIRLDNTGLLIMNLMKEHEDESSLLKALAEHFQASGSELSELSGDLKQFLSQLIAFGIITDDSFSHDADGNYAKTLRIGNIYIDLFGDDKVYPRNFDAFAADRQNHADLTVSAHIGRPRLTENGTVLIRNEELCIIDCKETYVLIFPEKKNIYEASLNKDGSRADFYIKSATDGTLADDMFHAIRLVFLYLAQKKGMFAIHSASIIYNGRAWLFSGRSGVGKSTHTAAWKKLCNTPIVNGDLNLITIADGGALVHGIPWCGTSNICDTKTYPLGGIVLLGRGSTDVVESLSDHEKALLVMQRFISPSWTDEQLSANIDFSSELIKLVPVCRLKCTANPSAVDRIKDWIDQL